jgi:hypothetical protein
MLLLDYEGPLHTGLYWFFMALPRLPLSSQKITWRDELPGELLLTGWKRFTYDLLEPILPLVRVKTKSEYIRTGEQFAVGTSIESRGPLTGSKRKPLNATSYFTVSRGLVSLTGIAKDEKVFELKNVSHQ